MAPPTTIVAITALAATIGAQIASAQDLPSTQYARVGAASVVVNNKWLLIGGAPASGSGSAYARALRAIGSNITSFDFSTKQVASIQSAASRSSSGTANRLTVVGQTCEYDKSGDKVYCFGGQSVGSKSFASGIATYDPTSNTWGGNTNTDIVPRSNHSSVALGNAFYIFGGQGSSSIQGDLHKVTFSNLQAERQFTDSWPAGRTEHCATALNDTAFIIFGGVGDSNKLLNDAWVYSTISNNWAEVTSSISGVNLARRGRSCVKVGSQIALFGGVDDQGQEHGDIYLLSNTTLKVTSSSNTSPSRRSTRPARLLSRNSIHRRQSSTASPGNRAGAQIANIADKFVGIAGGQGATNPVVNFFNSAASGGSGWAPSTSSLGNLLQAANAASPASSAAVSAPSTSAAAAAVASSATPAAPAVAPSSSPAATVETSSAPAESSPTAAAQTGSDSGNNAVVPLPVVAGSGGAASSAAPAESSPTAAAQTGSDSGNNNVPVPLPFVAGTGGSSDPSTVTSASTVSVQTQNTQDPRAARADYQSKALGALAFSIIGGSALCCLLGAWAVRRRELKRRSSGYYDKDGHRHHATGHNGYRDTSSEQMIQRSAPASDSPSSRAATATAGGAATGAALAHYSNQQHPGQKDNSLNSQFENKVAQGKAHTPGGSSTAGAGAAAASSHRKDHSFDQNKDLLNDFENRAVPLAKGKNDQVAAGASASRSSAPGSVRNQPATPHRSDSRRRAHSPLTGAALNSAFASHPGGDNTGDADSPVPASPASTHKRYKVLWNSTPSQPDEIEASPGDIVQEKRIFADGWAMVSNLNRGKVGMIPLNILEEIKETQ
ncbi:uncharacterized protein EV422DRAFT_233645 [Fimicolochytrium jonesii]|uniref:uncharacterized protein n=1 Tax=Fimicolochytrium jonesii TaxID=1396493 RepID=UPI0022FDC612|nr:uncharacterized protein EV422DRAFT_233645 [Fimicolochytrium jonesii]KAI8824794.1 hypothetical protein EV422DRAFT_233645 [Fimicolochytrium jonesii]